MYNDYLNNCR